MTKKYKVGVGVIKSIKNVLIIWAIPALVLLVDNWTQWIPENYHTTAIPVIGLISYFIKNYLSNR